MPIRTICILLTCLFIPPVAATPKAKAFFDLIEKSRGSDRLKQTGRLAVFSYQTGDFFTANLEFKRLLLFPTLKTDLPLQQAAIEYTYITAHAQSVKQQTDYWLNSTTTYIARLKSKAVINETKNQMQLRQFLQGDLFYQLGNYRQASNGLSICPSYQSLAQMRVWQKQATLNNKVSSVDHKMFSKPCSIETMHMATTASQADFQSLRRDYLNQDRHSNWVAVPLSIIFPGAGHMYNDRIIDGISSFAVVAVFAGLSAWAFSENSVALGSIAGAGALAFYGGNLYGTYNSTHDYNYNLDEKFLFRLELEFRPFKKQSEPSF